ncbi:MAG: hypothetical protein ACE1Y4_00585, partial [Lysobacterales bacterium]
MTELHTASVPARLSSTVILVRDSDDGPEVLMVQRHERTAFGGAYAFPGGVLSAVDCPARMRAILTVIAPPVSSRLADETIVARLALDRGAARV